MANRLTRVPESEPPPLPRWTAPVVLLADGFMLAMVSRPKSGSLRTTWVTPASLGLGVISVLLGIPLMLLLPAHVGGLWRDALLLLAGAFILGAACVSAVGLFQRGRF